MLWPAQMLTELQKESSKRQQVHRIDEGQRLGFAQASDYVRTTLVGRVSV